MQKPSEAEKSNEALRNRISQLEHELTVAKKRPHQVNYYSNLLDNLVHEVHVWEIVLDAHSNIKTWRLIDANKATLTAWDKDIDDVIGLTTDEIFNTNATEQFMPIVEKIFKENKPHTWITDFDGTGQCLQMTSIPCDSYFISTGIDITPIKKTQIALQDNILKLTEAISASNIGLWDWNIIDNTVYYSPEWKKQLGYDDDEIFTSIDEWQNRIHPDELHTKLKLVENSLHHGAEGHELECRMRHKDGSYRWILAHATIIRNDNNQAIRMIGSHLDITDRKHMESSMLQQQKMQALGTLAGGIAHDFNNLLTPILGYTELIKLTLPATSKQTQYLNQLEQSANRAKDLVQKILMMSRKSEVKIETVHLEKVVSEVIDLIKVSKSSGIMIDQHFEPNLPTIAADPIQIYQVILNLSTNAIQAMPNGGLLDIRLSLVNMGEVIHGAPLSTEHVCLSLKDSGEGMNEDTKQYIFDPFFTTKNIVDQRGTGLGLSLVASIIKQHHGLVTVDSTLDVGTEFKVYLPVVNNNEKPTVITKEFIKKAINQTIIFIDDEQALYDLGCAFLEEVGYSVVPFTDPEKALRYLSKNIKNIDLVITDYSMPNMTGHDVVQELKLLSVDIPIILVTGFTDMMTTQDQTKSDYDAVVSKPYNLLDFSQTINKVLTAKT